MVWYVGEFTDGALLFELKAISGQLSAVSKRAFRDKKEGPKDAILQSHLSIVPSIVPCRFLLLADS